MTTDDRSSATPPPLPIGALGKTGVTVTRLGLGGEGILRTWGYDRQARAVIDAALDEGITYFDCARAYDGSEEYYGSTLGARRKRIFLTSKAFERSRAGARAQLDATLRNMRTDHLDLWQVHDVRTPEDLDEIAAPGGALEAFHEARKEGKVRFIGVTGHQDPEVLTAAIDRFEFDTVLLPVSIAHPHLATFLRTTLPVAVEKSLGIIGMKVIGGSFVPPNRRRSPEALIRFALSWPVSTVVIGCSTPAEVAMNARIARESVPFSPGELDTLLAPLEGR